MSRYTTRVVLALALLAAVTASVAGVALAASHRHAAHRRYAGLSLKRILAANRRSSTSRVIVLLRNQYTALPPDREHAQARTSALHANQAPVQAAVRASGGRVNDSYRTFNAFAATVSSAERSRLAANPAVAKVLPDAIVPAPGPAQQATYSDAPLARRAHAAGTAPATTAPDGQPICPSDPSQPLLAPEALSIINAPQAQQLVTGSGVKVAFVADGLDINNPDFIRPDGSHVIVDYRDFSGDGLNAPTAGGEAFGDASSIAAQGTVAHDLSQFVNPAHPLPAGCNIVVKGVSPGASLVAMKVFGDQSNAFTSTILQGLDWAVAQDHVDVLNESFGGDNLPDTDQDATKQFNRLAVAAGVVVVTSSGDQGTANTIGSPASAPATISVAATTQFQEFAQTTRGGYQLSPNGWTNENIANFSSGGFTQSGATVDLAAPGNESYEACTADVTLYQDCKSFGGQPSNLGSFGGTSESSPLTAGVAALVIQAYRQTHGGQSPTPQLVKQIITSTARDLNIPSYEQGAGELDALAAVKAAESVGTGSPTGQERLVSPNQLDLAATAGTSTGATVRLTNVGVSRETYSSQLRTLGSTLSDTQGSATLDPASDPTFIDHLGVSQSYTTVHFTVAPGADRLDGAIAWPGPTTTVNMVLFDPSGKFTAFTYAATGEVTDYSHIDVRNPPAGTWTAEIFTPTSGPSYTGAVQYDLSTSKFVPTGNVSPAQVTLAPGASTLLHVGLDAPTPAGDYSRDLQISGSSGSTTVVPVVMRSLVGLQGGQGSFAGTITGGDGDGSIGREDTFAFDVPSGAPAIHVQMSLPDNPSTQLIGFLVSPDGQTVGQQYSAPSGDTQQLQIFTQNPQPGQWRFVIATLSPVSGTTTAGPFTGTVSLAGPTVSASGVPNGPGVQIAPGAPAAATVTVSNPGNTDLQVIIDPRLQQRTFYALSSITPATGIKLPLSAAVPPPEFLVPTETRLLLAAAHASAPITFDWGFGDPDIESQVNGVNAAGTLASPDIGSGIWFLAPALIGPFETSASGTADTGMAAYTRVFDGDVTSASGDPLLQDVDPTAPAGTPVDIKPGATATIPVTFAPTAAPGTMVNGDLFVDDYQAPAGSANELTAIPYSYRVGSPAAPQHRGGGRRPRRGH